MIIFLLNAQNMRSGPNSEGKVSLPEFVLFHLERDISFQFGPIVRLTFPTADPLSQSKSTLHGDHSGLASRPLKEIVVREIKFFHSQFRNENSKYPHCYAFVSNAYHTSYLGNKEVPILLKRRK